LAKVKNTPFVIQLSVPRQNIGKNIYDLGPGTLYWQSGEILIKNTANYQLSTASGTTHCKQ